MNNNMHILNEMVMAVCPIQNVYFQQDGYIGIVYQEPDISNEQQKQAAQEVISKWPLEEKKLEKLAQIDKEWQQVLSNGWDSGQGVLGISAEDVALLSANFSMAKEAANLGYPIPPIITLDNQEISFSDIQTMTVFMLQYGEYRSSISKTFAARRRAVQNASTIEEVVVI